MKKLVLLLSALFTALILVGCFDSTSDDRITIDEVDPVTSNVNAGDVVVINYSISASETVTQNNITVTFENADGTSAASYFTAVKSTFSAQYTYLILDPQSEVTVTVSPTCPTGVYTMKVTGDLGTSSSTQKVTLNVIGGTPATITSVADAAVVAGGTTTTAAVIAVNGNTLTTTSFSVSIANDINTVGTAPSATVSAYANGIATISINATSATAGTYTGTLTLGTGIKTFTVTVSDATPATITSVANTSVAAGSSITTGAVIAENGNTVSVTDLTVAITNDLVGTAPIATVSSYTSASGTGAAVITIDATNATAGTYTGTLTLGTDTKNFTVTVTASSVVLTEKALMLYNPYAKDGFNSAYNLVSGDPVAGETDAITGKMKYASSDSLVADLAVDNDLDIRSKLVTELTSINGGLFKVTGVTAADYTNATDVSLKALCADITSANDNEVLQFSVGDVFAMKLANSRGYVIFKITSFDDSDASSGSTANTGAMGIAYKFTAM